MELFLSSPPSPIRFLATIVGHVFGWAAAAQESPHDDDEPTAAGAVAEATVKPTKVLGGRRKKAEAQMIEPNRQASSTRFDIARGSGGGLPSRLATTAAANSKASLVESPRAGANAWQISAAVILGVLTIFLLVAGLRATWQRYGRHNSLIRDIGTYWFRLPALSKERREAEEEAAAGTRREPEEPAEDPKNPIRRLDSDGLDSNAPVDSF